MVKVKLIDVPIYKTEVYVCIGDFEDFKKWAKEAIAIKKDYEEVYESIKDSEIRNSVGRTYFDDAVGSYVVWAMPYSSKWEISWLNHELLHAVFHILNYVGVELDMSSEESYTYLHEYLFKQAIDDYNYLTYNY